MLPIILYLINCGDRRKKITFNRNFIREFLLYIKISMVKKKRATSGPCTCIYVDKLSPGMHYSPYLKVKIQYNGMSNETIQFF